jgi:tripartite ATP-independent transporter DctP family solute receptor
MRPKKMFYFFVIAVIFSFLVTSLHGAEKKEDKVYTCRIASHMSSKDSAGMACKKLGELLNKKSDGRIKAWVATDGELGSQREVVEQVHDGSIEITTTLPTGGGAYVPALFAFEFPYIYKDDAHMVRVMKVLRPYVEELLAPHNLKPLGALDIGFRHILNKKRPIYKVTDLKGLKMRGPNPMYVGMFNALGASGTTVTWTEVYTALQSGVVDGMEASPALIYAMKFHEQAKYLSKTYHIGANLYFMVGKKWFNSLPNDLQKLLVEATEEASNYQFEMEMKLEKEALDKLVAEGVKVNEVENINEFKDKLITFRGKYAKEKGPEFEKLYKKILEVK